MADIYITAEGKLEKEERLKFLKNVKRPEVLEKLKIARDFGDLSENSEYDAAKKEQTILETEILNIEETLRKAKIIENKDVKNDTATVGNFVTVLDLDFNEEETYKLVGVIESDPDKNYISNESPLGKAMLDKKVGETFSFMSPGGEVRMKIVKITK
ncbi:MAG: transcription elongation factor GreA [Clostridia bacterium]|nr:transcription elongation factor GreA [Clostridia bacterium]